MVKLISFISIVISLFLVAIAPRTYSYGYCLVCLCIFILNALLILKRNCKYNVVKFEFFFTIAFFFTNFVYPVIYYPVTPYFSLFNLSFPEHCVCKGIALSTLAYSAFSFGILKARIASDNNLLGVNGFIKRNSTFNRITIILLFSLCAVMFPILLQNDYITDWGEGLYIKALLDSMIYCTILIAFIQIKKYDIKTLFYSNKYFFILLGLYVLFATAIGNRGMIMRIGLLLVLYYTLFIKTIPKKYIIYGTIAGMCLMYVVGAVREAGTSLESALENSRGFWDIGLDLIINNRSQYVLIDYVDKYGITWGSTTLLNILSVIPFGQSIFLSLTNFDYTMMSSALIVTFDYYSPGDENLIGLGTNLVGDAYVGFGTIGVVVFMFGLGRFLKYLDFRIKSGCIISLFIYSLLFMEVIIFTRSTMLTPLRSIVWGIMLLYLFYPQLLKSSKYKLIKRS